MENLKIEVVGDEAKSKEAQELFFKLGYDWVYTTMVNVTVGIIYANRDGYLTVNPVVSSIHDYKETTLQELSDKVVLKRNNVGDATHVGRSGSEYYIGEKSYFWDGVKWEQRDFSNLGQLRPISEQQMASHTIEQQELKENPKLFLDPHNNYELIEWDGGFMIQDHWIEVPEGAEIYVVDNAVKEGRFYKKDDNQLSILSGTSWIKTQYRIDCFYEQMASCGLIISWQRHAQPEALNADKTAWDTQVGGNHYKSLAIQPMEYALKNKLDFAQANVVKYVTRHAEKNGKADLLKAKHYIDLMIEHYYGDL